MNEAGVVLAAVDGSEVTDAVLRWAQVLADRVGSGVRVVHVGTSTDALHDLVESRGLQLEDIDAPVAEALLGALESEDVSLAVLGTRGTSPGALPAGSTALSVLRGATKAVLLVPPAGAATGPPRLDRVAVPLDGTQEVSRALQDMLSLLLRGGADVLVVHVFDSPGTPAFWDHPARDARLWAGEFLARHCDGAGARAVLVAGDPGAAALETSDAERADAVLLAWRQDDSAGRALTLKRVLADSAVPVLVVPVVGRRP